LLEGKEKAGDWEKMQNWISQQKSAIKGPVYAVGTGGNISKLYNISTQVDENKTMDFEELKRVADFVSSYSYEERVNKLRLNTDRADVIVPAASIYITAMELAGCETIFVPDLGLKDGIIQMLHERMQARRRANG
jgi:exopolyphosphatase/guanosine-5'-triphosphate,3'-diphosphate pyrophosphatase